MNAISKNTKKIIIFLISLVLIAFCFKKVNDLVKTKEHPNILLISLDALRPDHLSCYGYPRKTSPNIDFLANQGLLFTNAIAQASFTGPSLPSILTSTYPPVHKVLHWYNRINPKLTSISKVLKKNGYITAFFSSHGTIRKIKGFKDNFDFYFDQWTYRHNVKIKEKEITKKVVNWIIGHKKEPFFLWVHYLEPHFPRHYQEEDLKEFFNQLINCNKKIVPVAKNKGFYGLPQRLVKLYPFCQQDLNCYIAIYDASIKYADRQVGIILQTLKDLGILEKTIIIITSDHGESLGEHRFLYFSHGYKLYDTLIKVPLIIYYPQLFKKKVINNVVEHINLGPTLFHILKIKKPKGMSKDSLVDLYRKGAESTRYAFSCNYNIASLRAKDWKLIRNYSNEKDSYEFYNLAEDPLEQENLYPAVKNRPEIKQLIKILNKYFFAGQGVVNQQENKLLFKKEDREIFKSLGYLE